MNNYTVALDVVVLFTGLILLTFNKQIGFFLIRNFGNLYGLKIEKMISWFPRFNIIVIGLLFAVGGFANLIQHTANN